MLADDLTTSLEKYGKFGFELRAGNTELLGKFSFKRQTSRSQTNKCFVLFCACIKF